MRTLFGVVFMLCILISSCAVKFGIKNILNLETTSRTHSPAAKFTGNGSGSQCSFCKEHEIITKSETTLSATALRDLAAFTFIILGGAFMLLKIQKHPVYDSTKIGHAIPIFLQYRKLII
ncbi:hypothetical protein [Chryseobacterium sp.]|uniref:hypothetical protein n=1 Tax=Chryseobacterium sp. TaxID=1871047 RepID=UPI0011CAB93E|nr:hypothetical protein [Chryseobacterium sp.]TXF78821.1 hypothetical protein FUA25_00015 [Chryseobacterium sp.]